ncbi:DUF6056 family protein [Risungbinella massiliensis]|uniref:DUF6056 family protein n=1 Tax=Risungbinella massiliensis TaxID=1329796 RepID=UPI0005CC18D0|nr:DUF6056 family protein [Risungbinella massiliensis]
MKRVRKLFLANIPFFVFFVSLIILNHYVPFFGDDFRYATYYGLDSNFNGRPLTFENVWESQLYDYFHFNGRFFVNYATVWVLTAGIEVWRVLNPFLLTCLAYAIFYTVYVRFPKKEDLSVTSILVSLFFLCNIYITRQTIQYAVGSFNYVYPMLFLFLLICFYRRRDLNQPMHLWAIPLWVLVGFLAGWSQEQIGALAIGFTGVWWIRHLWLKRPFSWATLIVAIFSLLGAAGLFFSPGSERRASANADFYQLPIWQKIATSLPDVIRFFLFQQTVYLLLFGILAGIFFYQQSKRRLAIFLWIAITPTFFFLEMMSETSLYQAVLHHPSWMISYGSFLFLLFFIVGILIARTHQNYIPLALTIGFLAADLMMTLTAGATGGRVAFPAIPLAIALLLYLFKHLRPNIIRTGWMILFIGYAVFQYGRLVGNYELNAHIHRERQQILEVHRGMQQGVIQVPALPNAYFAAYELDEHYWLIRAVRDHYQLGPGVHIQLVDGKR